MFEEELTPFKENSMKIRFFPTVEGNSQSPVKTLLFPISPLLDDEDKFASRQRAPRPGLVLKKGQRNSYRLFKTWPPDSIIRDIAVPLETHFPKAGSLPYTFHEASSKWATDLSIRPTTIQF